MKKPLIGITADTENSSSTSNQQLYVIRKNYCDSVINSGGIPIILTHRIELVNHYMQMIDGLIISGGNFDVDPSYFGEEKLSKKITVKPERTRFEFELTKKALKTNKPVLGICGGQQLLHVVLGGKLVQDIPQTFPYALEHEQANPRNEPGHTVTIINNTLLHSIIKTDRIPVNSAHHQAVSLATNDIIINAIAPDGVIEGIESKSYKFCLGVQWHPEYLISNADKKIISALIDASKN